MTQEIEDLERDIEKTRARLDLTIDRLQDKLSVSGIVDEVLGVVRAKQYGSTFDHALAVLKRNPVPVMLVAAGVGWLIHRMGAARPDGADRLPYDDAEMPVVDAHRPRIYEPVTAAPLPMGEAATLPRTDALEPRSDLKARSL